MSEDEEQITISMSLYKSLVEDSIWLGCLEEAGVYNWPGMEYASELFQQYNDEDEDE